MLAAVGRMALTAYLGTTLICVLIFDGWGAGQFGTWTHSDCLQLVGLISLGWLLFCPVWLRFFRFGPLEWTWRSLTFFRLQTLRRRAG